jgi:hypothetical protein
MKNLVKGMITNRLGIVLATLNVCYFVANGLPNPAYRLSNFGGIMLTLHTPAIIFTFIPLEAGRLLFSTSYLFSYRQFVLVLFVFFVTLQWLFIGWAAKAIARRIQPKLS